jgi:hypothetical protein
VLRLSLQRVDSRTVPSVEAFRPTALFGTVPVVCEKYYDKGKMIGQPIGFDNGDGITLNIGIVGAGIAGLTAAAVLSRLGHNVEVTNCKRLELKACC